MLWVQNLLSEARLQAGERQMQQKRQTAVSTASFQGVRHVAKKQRKSFRSDGRKREGFGTPKHSFRHLQIPDPQTHHICVYIYIYIYMYICCLSFLAASSWRVRIFVVSNEIDLQIKNDMSARGVPRTDSLNVTIQHQNWKYQIRPQRFLSGSICIYIYIYVYIYLCIRPLYFAGTLLRSKAIRPPDGAADR